MNIQARHGLTNHAVTLQSTSLNSGKLPSGVITYTLSYKCDWMIIKKHSTTEEMIAHYIAILQ